MEAVSEAFENFQLKTYGIKAQVHATPEKKKRRLWGFYGGACVPIWVETKEKYKIQLPLYKFETAKYIRSRRETHDFLLFCALNKLRI